MKPSPLHPDHETAPSRPASPSQARIGHTESALRRLLTFDRPADNALRDYFREHPSLGAQDRAFIAETVFSILRHRNFLEQAAAPPTPRRLVLACLVRIMGYSIRDIEGLLKRDESKWLAEVKSFRPDTLPLSVQAELPDWIIKKLNASMSEEEILTLGRSLQQPAPMDLRVNTIKADRDSVLAALMRDGIQAEPTPFSPFGIRLKDKPALNRHPLFLEGQVEVQDEGSQLLCLLVAPKRNDLVVDFCAGAGGKSLMLGALMQSHGRVYAFDISEKRLLKLKPRLKRSGLSNLVPYRIAGENDIKIKRLAGKIDRVLVDAPCSGLGTLRRNPDLKWRQSEKSVSELAIKQASILKSAASLVKPGGRLVYATCSLLPDENQDIVNAFLAAHPEFQLLDAGEILSPYGVKPHTGPFLRLLPHLHATDGFFAAAMVRSMRSLD